MKYIYICILSFFLLGLLSCEDWLELKPQNEVVLEDFWEDASDVEAVVAACYKAMLEKDFIERMILWGELRSDNIVPGPNLAGYQRDILDLNILTNNSLSQWKSFYTVIDFCNTVLEYAPAVTEKDPNFTPGICESYKSEVTALRALCYFYLIRTFRDVPYITTPTKDNKRDFTVPQTPESVILDSLVSDLTKSEKSAPESFSKNSYTKGRITKNAIRALLADIYLWKGDYEACISACDRILSSQSLALVQEPNVYYYVFYGKNSTESIFELQFSENNKNDKIFEFYGGQSGDHSGQLSTTDFSTFTDSTFYSTDSRKKDSFCPKSNGYINIFKYVGAFRATDNTGTSFYSYRNNPPNWIVYRLSDIMLMKAEALVFVRSGSENDLKASLSLVNTTYMRSNPDLSRNDTLVYSNYNSMDKMENLVMLEKQRELIFEGKRWFDLLRFARRDKAKDPDNNNMLDNYLLRKYPTNLSIVRTKLSPLDALYLPIHADEIKANPKLKQNPYYTTATNK